MTVSLIQMLLSDGSKGNKRAKWGKSNFSLFLFSSARLVLYQFSFYINFDDVISLLEQKVCFFRL